MPRPPNKRYRAGTGFAQSLGLEHKVIYRTRTSTVLPSSLAFANVTPSGWMDARGGSGLNPIDNISGVGNATGPSSRTGRQQTVTGIFVKGIIEIPEDNTTAYSPHPGQYTNLWLVLDRHPPLSGPTDPLDIFMNTAVPNLSPQMAPQTFLRQDNTARFVVLDKVQIVRPPINRSTVSIVNVTPPPENLELSMEEGAMMPFELNWTGEFVSQYSGTGGSAWNNADISTNSVSLYACSSAAGNITTRIHYFACIRFYG